MRTKKLTQEKKQKKPQSSSEQRKRISGLSAFCPAAAAEDCPVGSISSSPTGSESSMQCARIPMNFHSCVTLDSIFNCVPTNKYHLKKGYFTNQAVKSSAKASRTVSSYGERLLWNWKNHLVSWKTLLLVLVCCLLKGSIQCRQLEKLAKDYRNIPPPFELEGMLYYSTSVKHELIGQAPFLKCKNVK